MLSCAVKFNDLAKFGKYMDFFVQNKNMDMAICIGFIGTAIIKWLLSPKSILYLLYTDKIRFGDQTVQLEVSFLHIITVVGIATWQSTQ